MSWQEHLSKGTVLMVKADYRNAEQELRKAVETAESLYGKDDERVKRALGVLGQLELRQSHLEHADELLTKSVEGNHSAACNTLARAADLMTLAAIKRQSGDLSGSNYRYQQAIDLLRLPPADNEGDFASNRLENLFSQVESRSLVEVDRRFRQLLTGAQERHDSMLTEPAQVPREQLNKWVNLLQECNRLLKLESDSSALDAYSSAHSSTKLAYRLFDHDHPNIALSLLALANSSSRLHMYEQTENLLLRAATIYGGLAPFRNELRNAKLHLASFYATISDYPNALRYLCEAAELIEETVDVREKGSSVHTSLSLTVARTELYECCRDSIRQAIECEESGAFEQSLALYDRAATLLKRIFPSDHLELAQMFYFKANVLRKLNRTDEAEGAEKDAELIESTNTTRERRWQLLSNQVPPFKIPPSRTL